MDDKKKILVVDDSALMRRVLCDIINSDKRFQVVAKAADGVEAFDLLSRQSFDGVVLDINMPRMDGLEVLRQLRKYKIAARVLIASTDSSRGAKVTLDALELGALDFIQKPGAAFACRGEEFTRNFLDTLYAVSISNLPREGGSKPSGNAPAREIPRQEHRPSVSGHSRKTIQQIVAIASSTGGPKALQRVIPYLPENLDAPVVIVQHMPKGFTASLAERLDEISALKVCEAQEGQELEKGNVYIAMGGSHMKIVSDRGRYCVHYTDEPPREGVKPSANYMYESLMELPVQEITCVVLTGMGADGTEGIGNLRKRKKVYAIAQGQESCVVYGMPRCLVREGYADKELPLENIAGEIAEHIGVV